MDREEERRRRRETILGGMLNPGELTLDPEIAREPELAGLTPPRPDVQLGGMDDESDRLRRLVAASNRAYGFRWNPDSEEGARNLASERSAAIKSVYGESPLKQENTRSQIAAREAAITDRRTGMQQRSTAAADRLKVMRDRLDRDLKMDPIKKRELLARVAAFEGRGAADLARAAEIEERLPYAEDKALLELDRLESEIGKDEASTRLSDQRADKLKQELPKQLSLADQKLLKMQAETAKLEADPVYRQFYAQLAEARARMEEARGDDQAELAALREMKIRLDAISRYEKGPGFFARASNVLTGGQSDKDRAIESTLKEGLGGSPGTPRTPKVSIPSAPAGGAKLPTEKPGKDTSPAAKPSGDTTTAQAPGVAPAGSAREGGATAAERVDLERRTQAGTGKGRRSAAEIRAELAKLRAMR